MPQNQTLLSNNVHDSLFFLYRSSFMAMTATQKQDAYKFFIVSFGAITGVEYMNQINDAYNAGLTTKEIVNIYSTKPQFEAIYPRFFSNEQFADRLIENVVGASATAAAKTQAKADVVAAINAGWTKGDVVFQIFTNLSNKPADSADWGKTAAMLNNKVKVAEYYTETLLVNSRDLDALGAPLQSVTNDAASVEAAKDNGSLNNGQTYTLTTGQDNVQGTAGNDTILGVNSGAGGGNNTTLTAADVINGGAGKDSLMATLDAGSAGVLPAAQYSNLENFFVRNVSGTNGLGADGAIGGGDDAVTFNFATVTGEEQVWNDRSTNSVLFNNLAAGTTVGVKGEGTVVAATGATYVATATAANIALDGGLAATAAGATGGVQIQGAGLRSATVTSTNGTNNISFLTLAGGETSLTVDAQSNFAITDAVAGTAEGITGAGLTSITVKGAGSANLGTAAIPNAIATVDASANTGGVTLALNGGTAASNGLTFKGGSGNDVVTTNGLGGTLLTTASIDAGAGTADRLVVANTNDILIPATPLSKAQGDLYKGFEQVQVQNGVTVNLDLLATNNTIDAVRINDGNLATGVTNLSATGAQNVTILAANSAAGAITIGVKGATTTGQIDTVKAAVTTTTAAGALQNIDLTGIVLTGVENLELTGSNGADKSLVGSVTLTTTAATDLSSIKLNNGNVVDTVAGNNNVITVAAGQAAINLTIDATGSGDTTVNAAAYNTATGARITTGAGNDVIQGSVRSDVIVAGDGDDIIQGDVALTLVTPAVPHQATVTLSGAVELGDVLSVTVNGNVINFTADSNVVATAATNFAAAITAAPAMVAAGITASALGGVVTLSNAAGTAFNVTAASATNAVATAQVTDIVIPAGTYNAGDVISVTLNGDVSPSTYTVQTGDTLATIVAGVAAAINADANVNAAVTAAASPTAGSVRVTSDVAGTAFTVDAFTVVDSAGAQAQQSTMTVATADLGAGSIGVNVNGTFYAAPYNTSAAQTAADLAAFINARADVNAIAATVGTDEVITVTAAVAGTPFTLSGAVDTDSAAQPLLATTVVNREANANVNATNVVTTTTITANVANGADNTQALANDGTTQIGVAAVFNGGAFAADTLTGGAGNDTFVVLGGAGDNGSTFTTMDTITDLNLGGANQAGRVDVIDLNPGAGSTITALVNAGQPVAMNAQATSLSAAVNGLFTVGATLATAVNGTAGLFTYNNDTYLIALNGGAVGTFDGNDTIIKVTGVVGTLDLSDFI